MSQRVSAAALVKTTKKASPGDVSRTQAALAELSAQAGGDGFLVTQRELATRTGIPVDSVSSSLKALETSGRIERTYRGALGTLIRVVK